MKLLKAILFASSLVPTVLLAHTELKASNPANGAVVNKSPENIKLSFSEDVQLLKLVITDSSKKAVPIAFSPSAATQEAFTVVLPALKEGAYAVKWTALGDDGHKVEHSFNFTVDAHATESAGMASESHAEHKH